MVIACVQKWSLQSTVLWFYGVISAVTPSDSTTFAFGNGAAFWAHHSEHADRLENIQRAMRWLKRLQNSFQAEDCNLLFPLECSYILLKQKYWE